MEKNKTAVSYIEDNLNNVNEGYQYVVLGGEEYVNVKHLKYLIEEAKQKEKREVILLLNWILKHYETHTDSNYMFCWKSPSGKELDSVDLAEQYYYETYESNL